MMASALVKFVRGFVRRHSLKKKKVRRVMEHRKANDTHVLWIGRKPVGPKVFMIQRLRRCNPFLGVDD
jgi:hypothetical protein